MIVVPSFKELCNVGATIAAHMLSRKSISFCSLFRSVTQWLAILWLRNRPNVDLQFSLTQNSFRALVGWLDGWYSVYWTLTPHTMHWFMWRKRKWKSSAEWHFQSHSSSSPFQKLPEASKDSQPTHIQPHSLPSGLGVRAKRK